MLVTPAQRLARLRTIRNNTLEKMKIFPRQAVTKFMTLFDEAISRAEAQGNLYDDERKKALIEEALDNGEPELAAFSTSLQLTAGVTWNDVRDRCITHQKGLLD